MEVHQNVPHTITQNIVCMDESAGEKLACWVICTYKNAEILIGEMAIFWRENDHLIFENACTHHTYLYLSACICVCVWILSWCCAASMDFPDPLYHPSFLPGLPDYILYWHRAPVDRLLLVNQFFLIHVKGPWEYITYEFILIYPAVSCMSGLSNLGGFRDGW